MPNLRSAWPLAFVLADLAGRDGRVFASVEHLHVRTGLSATSVKSALAKLRAAGLLIDTGARVGKTGPVKVCRLSLPELSVLHQEVVERIASAKRDKAENAGGNRSGSESTEDAQIVSKTGPLNDVKQVTFEGVTGRNAIRNGAENGP